MDSRKAQDMAIKQLLSAVVLLLVTSAQASNQPPSTMIYDIKNDTVIKGNYLNITRPIASLTKIMTALVAIEHDDNLDRAVRSPAGSRLPPGMVTRRDLFSVMLVRSDNAAADALAADYPGGTKAFVRQMNHRARTLGMQSTRFVDASGLSAGNMATIGDVATLLLRANSIRDIAEMSVMPQVEYQRQRYTVVLENTNRSLLANHEQIRLSKTGYTRLAGWNVGMVLRHQGRSFVIIVLGARTKDERYETAKRLIADHIKLVEMVAVSDQPQEVSMWRRAVDFVVNLRREDLP